MPDQEKQFWCPTCLFDVPLDQAKVVDIRAAEGEQLFFAQTVHALCRTPLQEKDSQLRVAGLPPKWSETAEDVRRMGDELASFTHDAYRVQVAQREEDLKAMVRRAIQLVEENPPNEPMRTPISRPAVERMLAEDLERTGLGRGEREDLAHELFDLGWRPTIERLAR